MLTDMLAELSEEEWRDHEAALDNAWHLDLFEQADGPSKSRWGLNTLAFRRGSQKGERGIHGVILTDGCQLSAIKTFFTFG